MKNQTLRKPGTKFLTQAEKEYGIDIKQSFVIGDRFTDIKLGKNAGTTTILVLTGDGKDPRNKDAGPDYTANDLVDAAKWILNKEN